MKPMNNRPPTHKRRIGLAACALVMGSLTPSGDPGLTDTQGASRIGVLARKSEST